MKMKFGALVTDGRGKIGGHVASKNRAGAYLRTKVTPVNPNTSDQATVRGRITSLSQAWKSLSEAERNSWNSSVGNWQRTDVFGDLKNPSGFNLYMRLNANLLEAGAATLTIAPQPGSVPAPLITAFDFDADPNDISLTASPNTVPADTVAVLKFTAGVSPGRNFVKNLLRIVQVVPAAGNIGSGINSPYTAKFGEQAEGVRVSVELYCINTLTGQKGAVSSATAVTT